MSASAIDLICQPFVHKNVFHRRAIISATSGLDFGAWASCVSQEQRRDCALSALFYYRFDADSDNLERMAWALSISLPHTLRMIQKHRG